MDRPISFRLPAELRRSLERSARRQKRPASDVAREALRRYLALEEFQMLRAGTLPLAERRGILTDEDVFERVS